jgi:hypothetical protein
MTEAYNDALTEQAKQGVWATLKEEAINLPAIEKASLVADVAGIFDPTPISDGVGGVLSLAQGDFLGAGLSVVGMIPYVGDLGKIAKIGKRAPRTAKILQKILTKGDDVAKAGEKFLRNNYTLKQIAAAREQATKRVREALLKARNKLPCKDCAKLKNGGKKQLQMPSGTGSGKWKTPDGLPPKSGSGTYTFDTPVELPDGRKVSSIEYREGFPDFDKYTVDGKHTLWEVSGNANTDANRLTEQMRETNPGYKPPDSDDYVLHHFEDGQVGYVPRDIHDRAAGGVAHSGGNTIVNNDLF